MRVNSTETNDNEFTEPVHHLGVTQTGCVTGSLPEAGSALTSEAWDVSVRVGIWLGSQPCSKVRRSTSMYLHAGERVQAGEEPGVKAGLIHICLKPPWTEGQEVGGRAAYSEWLKDGGDQTVHR